ncbi:hypothetical protein ABBQ38_015345 [Trebouxia sp. C0009 RCD-2024]
MQQCKLQQIRQLSALPVKGTGLCAVRTVRRRPLYYKVPRTYKFEEQNSDTTPTTYGEIETVGSTASSGSESGKGYYGEGDDEDDRPLPDQNTREKFHEVKEDVKDDVAEVTKGVKDDIQSATGDLEEDLGQLNVEELLENVADPKEFGKRGEPLFFGQLLLLAMIFFPPAFFKTLVSSIGLASIIGGLCFTFLGAKDMGSNFYPFTAARKGNKLVTKGLFRYVRHPMYCGLCFLSFGLCAITGSQARLALSVAFWILLNHKANVEESEMNRLHGKQYSEYSSRVSKLIPGIF